MPLLLCALLLPGRAQDQVPLPDLPFEPPAVDATPLIPFVEELLPKLSLEDKAGQMTQLALSALSKAPSTPIDPDAHVIDEEKLRHAIVDRRLGSILNVHGSAFSAKYWQVLITKIQRLATEQTAHGIPVIYGINSVHGANCIHEATLFPHSLGLAASRNPELVTRCAAASARETRAVGIPWSFSPVLDVARQPLWSRFVETFGEDVHLCTVLGDAAVRGLQGGDIAASDRVAACGKHFLGYGFPFSGHDRTQTLVPERYLREYFLPPFWGAIDNARLRTLMVNSGEINGIPVHANHSILTKLLRGQMGFEGVVVTDWKDVSKLHEYHRVAPTLKEAVRVAVEAGIDMCMAPGDYHFTDHLIDLVREGAIPEERLDQSVRRILNLKFELGLFDNPYPEEEAVGVIGDIEAGELSLEAARESLVLLQNDGVLPFDREARLLLTGPGCHSRAALHGAWSYTWQGDDEAAYPRGIPTILAAFSEAHGRDNVAYVPGTTYDEVIDLDRAARAAHSADIIVCVLAEKPGSEQPANINDLALPDAQQRLVRELSFGKPLVLVLLENRPRIITEAASLANAVLWAGHPGPRGGRAIHEVLVGEINPSGKLPFTYPRFPHKLITYDHKLSDTADGANGYTGFNPLYEFGHGLGYATIEYANLKIEKATLTPFESLQLTVDVRNTGDRPGAETVHVFVRDLYASISPPVKRLRAFRKIPIAPGESRTVAFEIPVGDLGFHDRSNEQVVEPGAFEVCVGDLREGFTVE